MSNRYNLRLGSIIFLLISLKCSFLFAQSDFSDKTPMPALNPNIKFPTLEAYEAECKEPGVMFDDARLRLFAPKRKAESAKIIFGYLLKAYDELYRIVGVYPEYKLVVYHFPEKNEYAWGGTSECSIWYSYKNLDLESQEEWKQYQIPHLSGYIEEMAHNFCSAAGAQFGWETIGWNLGIKATKKVAGDPILTRQINQTRAEQKETFQRYIKSGYTFPKDLPGNLCDRIHAHLLWVCEQRYGPDFWRDFFKQVLEERENLKASVELKDPDKIRNKKYQITIECFDRLKKTGFKSLLEKNQISLTTDIKSLHPADPNWDRKFLRLGNYNEPRETIAGKKASLNKPIVDVNKLSPLHKAVYGGHYQASEQLIAQGASINEKGRNGWTPLHLAAVGGHQKISELLLKKGADINIVDDNGRTALELAEICGHNGLAGFLRAQK